MRLFASALFAVALFALFALSACGEPPPMSAADARAIAAAAEKKQVRVDVDVEKMLPVEPRVVSLALTMEPLRTHAVGRHIGPILLALPQFKRFFGGSVQDPVTEVDWGTFAGTDAHDPAKGVAFFHMRTEAIDSAIERLARESARPVGDMGSPGTKAAMLGEGRVVFRERPELAVIVPEERASEALNTLKQSNPVFGARPGEVVRALVERPSELDAHIPAAVQRARATITARPDGGANLHVEGDCADAAQAAQVADDVRARVDRANAWYVRLATRNLLDGVTVAPHGSQVHIELPASRPQLEVVLRYVASSLHTSVQFPAQ